MTPLQMTDSEIRTRYRDGAQVYIIAQLNACSPERIISILGDKYKPPNNDAEIERLYGEGKNDTVIARSIGVSRYAVECWRQKHGLPSNQANKPRVAIPHEKALELYNKGLVDTEIAKAIGCAQSTVNIWRAINGLPCHRTKADGGRKSAAIAREKEKKARGKA